MELTPKAHFEIKTLGYGISRDFQELFFTEDEILFCQNTSRTKNNGVEMSQAFYDIAWFECFTDLTLFKYAFSVIQRHSYVQWCFFFVSSYVRRR